jgi:hypothetical protein
LNAETPPSTATDAATSDAPASDEAGSGKLLLIVFWVWAGLLAVAAVAQLLGLDSVLNVLDVKRWFAR